jgi:DNA-binding response OmpR family regulator
MNAETPETIIVVDDEQSIIDFVGIYLEREGFVCKGINDGLVAFNDIMQSKPTLVVLDVILP